jgi:membrane protease YdiL (CAAX protease family)
MRLAVLLGLVAVVCIGAMTGLWMAMGWPLHVPSLPPKYLWSAFLRACVFSPLLEEAVYRVALCVPLTAVAGPWRAVAASGVLFSLLHVIYGNPCPDNALGGFFFAWAYVRSGSMCVPVLLHSLGNVFALSVQVRVWYWLGV